MDINFNTKKLQKLCSDHKQLTQKYGAKQARQISMRLQQLSAADNLLVISKLPQFRCHELKGNRKGQLAIDLIHPLRLVFNVDQKPIPKKLDGGLDWAQSQTIKILEIEDYHGKQKKK